MPETNDTPRPARARRRTLLVLSQTFVPDPAAVGQYMADVAAEMARRGYPVRVYASARGYENPSVRYPPRESIGGLEIRRLPLASFGKKSLLTRVLGTAAFMAQALFAGLFTRNVGGVFFSTSPPLVGLIASIVGRLRGVPIAYWAMDLNPDQLIALGKLKPADPAARVLEGVNRHILRRSSLVIALDRFMAERLERRGAGSSLRGRMLVMPPWPQEDRIVPAGGTPGERAEGGDERGRNPFRLRHGLGGRFVVMYSGNHSPSNPLSTLLEAVVRLRDDPGLCFAFVGGGTGKKEVEAVIRDHRLTNAVSIPYQPLSELRHSLSAADLHVVSLGPEMVGIIHPCKVYGAMAAARPVLYFGPRPSHVTDLLDARRFGLHVAHGDVDGAVRAIRALRDAGAGERARMGRTGRAVLRRSLGREALLARFCDRLEWALFGAAPPLPRARGTDKVSPIPPLAASQTGAAESQSP